MAYSNGNIQSLPWKLSAVLYFGNLELSSRKWSGRSFIGNWAIVCPIKLKLSRSVVFDETNKAHICLGVCFIHLLNNRISLDTHIL